MRCNLGRRRFLAITAAAAAAVPLPSAGAAGDVPLHVWNGTALGARASLRLYHPDAAIAEGLLDACRAEIERLERVFSLYRPDSAVSRLNAAGRLDAPPLDLVRLLDEGRRISNLTDGVFDVTVQPLWRLFAEHFARAGAAASGPDEAAIQQSLERVGYRHVEIDSDRIRFGRPGMSVTLNGIAQGYVTDRVAELLRNEGMDNVLVDLGEGRAFGSHSDGRPWVAALEDPVAGGIFLRLPLVNGAIATSAPAGFAFDPAGRFGHIVDPRSGRPGGIYASVSVVAPDATTADALSTAFVQMSRGDIAWAARGQQSLSVHLLHGDGRHEKLMPS